MASTYLTRTPASAGNRDLWTWSGWIKRSALSTNQKFFSCGNSSLTFMAIQFNANDSLSFGDLSGGSTVSNITTNQVFRDVSAWYHIVAIYDSGNATSTDRLRLYVNGSRVTSLTDTTFPAQNTDGLVNSTTVHNIGQRGDNNHYFDGEMSHVHFIDGTAYDASAFGETDANGVWTIKTSPSVTYGTNGFFILKNGNSVTDQSGNGNNFTVAGGTLTNTEDSPSNVFCTMNPLNGVQPTGGLSLSNGNTTFLNGENGSNYAYVGGTLAINYGKWYWETKVTDLAEIDQVGVALASSSFAQVATNYGLQGTQYGGKAAQFSNGYKVGNGTGSAYMGAFSANDIMMVALDLDNNKITFGRNGQWADGAGNANQTFANSTAAYTDLTSGEFYMPAQAKRAFGGNTGTNQYNFGNGYFGTTAVSSAGTNASGNGIFEYDVPTGYTALCTKGLNGE